MTLRAALATVFCLIVVAGCSSSGAEDTSASPSSVAAVRESDLVIPAGDEPEVLGPLGETNLDVDTGDGSVQIGTAEVPESVASSFPVPDDLVVQIASEEGGTSGFSGVSALEFDELRSFFEEQLPIAGYEWSQSRLVDGVVAVYAFDGPDGSGEIAVSSAPSGGRSVLVTFTQ